MHKFFFFKFIPAICVSLLISFLLYGDVSAYRHYDAQVNYSFGANIDSLDSVFEAYLERQNNNVEKWLTFVSILSTIFAVFFVYAGFKIDSTKEKVDEAEKRILNLEKNIQEDIYEYARQLEYCMSYIVQHKIKKAIDALSILSHEHFVLKDNRKQNTCYFLLPHCYYEKSGKESGEVKKESLAEAVYNINLAIEDATHPLKIEIISAFNAVDKS